MKLFSVEMEEVRDWNSWEDDLINFFWMFEMHRTKTRIFFSFRELAFFCFRKFYMQSSDIPWVLKNVYVLTKYTYQLLLVVSMLHEVQQVLEEIFTASRTFTPGLFLITCLRVFIGASAASSISWFLRRFRWCYEAAANPHKTICLCDQLRSSRFRRLRTLVRLSGKCVFIMNFEVSLGLLTSEPMSYVTHHDCGLLSIDKLS